jgi:hypothetical protein
LVVTNKRLIFVSSLTIKTKKMETLKFTYSDSVAGMQNETFAKLSEIIKYIEDFGHEGDETSYGVIFQNDEPVLEYESNQDGLTWRKADA